MSGLCYGVNYAFGFGDVTLWLDPNLIFGLVIDLGFVTGLFGYKSFDPVDVYCTIGSFRQSSPMNWWLKTVLTLTIFHVFCV